MGEKEEEEEEKPEPESPYQKDGTPVTDLLVNPGPGENKIIRMQLLIGDQVELFGNQTGIIRYAGEVHFTTGNLYGIELNDGSIGKNNGDHAGQKYFEVTKKNKGVFIRAKQIRRKTPQLVETEYVIEQRKKEQARI